MGAGEERTGPLTYEVRLTPTALDMLRALKDRHIQKQIGQAIDGLAHEPEKQGKPLRDELLGYRGLRVVGQRYRVIYAVAQNQQVVVIAVGLRKEGDKHDVYRIASKLVRFALHNQLDPNSGEDTTRGP